MIGILFESNEWSDHKLLAEIEACGVPSRLINMEDAAAETEALACDLLVSRVFASAQFRNHQASLDRMPYIIEAAEQLGIPLINPGRAHFFETDKHLATKILASAGFVTPALYACALPSNLNPTVFVYPCIIKPNCGGRTTYTTIAHNETEARLFLTGAPSINFIVEEYVIPTRQFLTRIEVVDSVCALMVKRSIAACGLSAYHLGSTYQIYQNCSDEVKTAAEGAARTLSIEFGSFDIIESDHGACIIDANSVSNVSVDCAELFKLDLMKAHAQAIARRHHLLRSTPKRARIIPLPANQ